MTGSRSCRTVRAAVFAASCVLLAATGHALMSSTPLPWWALPGAAVTTFAGAWLLAGRERGILVVTSASVVAQAALHTWFSLAQALHQASAGGGASLAQQWARHLLCGTAGSGTVPEADAVRAVTDAGLADRLNGPAPGHTHHSMGMQETLASGGAAGATGPSGAAGAGAHSTGAHEMAGTTASSMPDMPDAHSVPSVQDMAGMAGLHSGHDMGGMSPLGMLAAHLLAALLCGLWLAHGERAAFRVGRAVAGWLVAPLRLPLRLPQPPHRPRLRPRRDFAARNARRLLLVHAITSRGPPHGTAVI